MTAFSALLARELRCFGLAPSTYLIAALFAVAAGLLAFPPGNFTSGLLADPIGYARAWPWLLGGLGVALGARMWAREVRRGSFVLLLSQPTPLWLVGLAKFLAAWAVAACGVVILIPLLVTAGVVAEIDLGASVAALFGALLLTGFYVAVGAAASAAANDEPTALAIGGAVAAGLTLWASPPAGWPAWLAGYAEWSPAASFTSARLGVLQISELFHALASTVLFLALAWIAVDARRAG